MLIIELNSSNEITTSSKKKLTLSPQVFTVKANTNTGIETTEEYQILIKKPGIYEIQGSARVMSGGEGNYGIDIYCNDEQYGMSFYNLAAAANEVSTVSIYQNIIVVPDVNDEYVTIQFWPVGTTTVQDGIVSIKKVS